MSVTHIPAALRRLVRERAGDRCEYCLFPQATSLFAHPVDHIIAEKHGGQTVADNLALSCTICNGRKGSDLASIDPESGAITSLFHPRRDDWLEHFNLAGAVIEPRTATGRAAVRLLRFNDPDRLAERQELIDGGLFPIPKGPIGTSEHNPMA